MLIRMLALVLVALTLGCASAIDADPPAIAAVHLRFDPGAIDPGRRVYANQTIEEDGVAGTGTEGTVELVSTVVGCGALTDSWCVDVTLRHFNAGKIMRRSVVWYDQTTLTDCLYGNAPPGIVLTNADPLLASGVANPWNQVHTTPGLTTGTLGLAPNNAATRFTAWKNPPPGTAAWCIWTYVFGDVT